MSYSISLTKLLTLFSKAIQAVAVAKLEILAISF